MPTLLDRSARKLLRLEYVLVFSKEKVFMVSLDNIVPRVRVIRSGRKRYGGPASSKYMYLLSTYVLVTNSKKV